MYIFGDSNVVKNSDYFYGVFPKTRIIPTYEFSQLKENIRMVDDEDIIIHNLTNDARNIFKQYYKSHIKQQIELEKLAKVFCNFVKYFSHKKPSLNIYISLVLPIAGRIYEIETLNNVITECLKNHQKIKFIPNNNIMSCNLLSDGIHINLNAVKIMISNWEDFIEQGIFLVIILHYFTILVYFDNWYITSSN